MSIDYYSCKYCGDTFPDCGDYTGCNCGETWCGDECAEKDGFKRAYCKLGKDTDDHEDCEEDYCCDCDNFVEESCKYCREEDFEDNKLLRFLLNKIGISREELIEEYKLGGRV